MQIAKWQKEEVLASVDGDEIAKKYSCKQKSERCTFVLQTAGCSSAAATSRTCVSTANKNTALASPAKTHVLASSRFKTFSIISLDGNSLLDHLIRSVLIHLFITNQTIRSSSLHWPTKESGI